MAKQHQEANFPIFVPMETLLSLAIDAALEAGKTIMEVYATPFEVYVKSDASPVTQADLRASNLIKEMLETSNLPFVSEEVCPTTARGFQDIGSSIHWTAHRNSSTGMVNLP